MIRDGFVFCDFCRVPMGQLWNQPAAAPDLLPAPDFRVCDDCFCASCVFFDHEIGVLTNA